VSEYKSASENIRTYEDISEIWRAVVGLGCNYKVGEKE
jgi:hypothetical protein